MNTCKIKSIKKVSCNKTPVYDINVPIYHNFVLANGLVVHNCVPYQYFKSTIYEKRLEMYNDKTLVSEIIDLERNIDTGKVDHPDGGKKDVSDAVCGAIFNASKHAEEFAYDYGESSEETLRLNGFEAEDDIKQLTVSLEEELKAMRRQSLLVHPSDADTGTEDYCLYDDIIII